MRQDGAEMRRRNPKAAVRPPMTLPLLMALSLLTVVALSACNTVSGAGEDLQAAGSAIEQKSDQKKGY